MKLTKIVIGLGIASLFLISCENQNETANETVLNNEIDSVSYAIGVSEGQALNQKIKQGFSEGNIEALLKGYQDAMDSTVETKMSKEELQMIVQSYFSKKQEEQMAKLKAENETKYASVKEEGERFLAENSSKDGVITTESGLQYKVIKSGNGPTPKPTDNVICHYHGTFIDGNVFDSSVERNEPATFPVTGVIKGWIEALQLMKVGDKWQLFIPYELAYGEQGRGGIPPYSMLIFDIELLEIAK